MQCFKLVNGGFVDRVIVFDELPKRLMAGIKTRQVAGFPRSWAKWLASIGSVRDVMKTETTQHPDRSYTFKYTPIGKEPCFYVLDYQDINADKDAWRAISEHLRLNLGPEIRLREKVEDMAIPLSENCNSPLNVEPEDIPVIPVPPEVEKEKSSQDLVEPEETILVNELAPKRRGRPKRVALEV